MSSITFSATLILVEMAQNKFELDIPWKRRNLTPPIDRQVFSVSETVEEMVKLQFETKQKAECLLKHIFELNVNIRSFIRRKTVMIYQFLPAVAIRFLIFNKKLLEKNWNQIRIIPIRACWNSSRSIK